MRPSRAQSITSASGALPETFNLYRKWDSRIPELLAIEGVQTAATASWHGANALCYQCTVE